jgi:hypothetical protein
MESEFFHDKGIEILPHQAYWIQASFDLSVKRHLFQTVVQSVASQRILGVASSCKKIVTIH